MIVQFIHLRHRLLTLWQQGQGATWETDRIGRAMRGVWDRMSADDRRRAEAAEPVAYR